MSAWKREADQRGDEAVLPDLLMRTGIGVETLKVFFFGDSICFGQGVSLHKGWVTRISAVVGAISAHVECDVLVVNASVNGDTTRLALERMPYDVQSHGVDILLVQFGMNDCNYWQSDRGNPRVSREAFRANLTEIIVRARSFGARRVLLNTNHPTLRDTEPMPGTSITYDESNRAYNAVVRDVGASAGPDVAVNDVERSFLDHTGGRRDELAKLVLDDGLHLSEAGHDLYFAVVEPALRAAVEETLELA